MTILIVGIGGIFGGLCRFRVGQLIARRVRTTFPWGTFFINITGAFLLGLLTGLQPAKSIYVLLGDGFLGAYTTFSTFMYESFQLFQENEKLNAFVYILGSLFVGITGYLLGFFAGSMIH